MIDHCLLTAAEVAELLSVPERWVRDASKRRLPLVERPREPRRKWRILSPAETQRTEQAFAKLIDEAETDRDRDDLVVVRRLSLLHMGTSIRRSEAGGLRWRATFLADPGGPLLRIEETWVRGRVERPKSEAGERTIALGEKLAAELWEHRRWSQYQSDEDFVLPNPRTGNPFDANRYAELCRLAFARAGIEGITRPSHELRHSSITNAAAAGTPPEALMTRSGHSSYATTKRYIDLAGERFRGEAHRLEDRLWGSTGTKNGYQIGQSSSGEDSEHAAKPHA